MLCVSFLGATPRLISVPTQKSPGETNWIINKRKREVADNHAWTIDIMCVESQQWLHWGVGGGYDETLCLVSIPWVSIHCCVERWRAPRQMCEYLTELVTVNCMLSPICEVSLTLSKCTIAREPCIYEIITNEKRRKRDEKQAEELTFWYVFTSSTILLSSSEYCSLAEEGKWRKLTR